MIGPSRCPFCTIEEETSEHLLILCTKVQTLWENLAQLFRQTDKSNDGIKETIVNWRKGRFHCQVINRAWTLSYGFLVWNIWKERNQRIFQDKEQPMNNIWQHSIGNIRETILTKSWSDEDWKTVGIESQIVEALNLKPQMLNQGL